MSCERLVSSLILLTISSASRNVRLWNMGEYDENNRLPSLVPITLFKGLLGLSVATVGRANLKVWATISLNNGISFFPLQNLTDHL